MTPEQHARPLDAAAFHTLLARARDARFVLLGEATHGTHEFYALRAELTKRLIEEHGFAAVAAEADWPDAIRVDAYVRGASGDESAADALADFRRFPAWMWRNRAVVDFVEWLRDRNDAVARDEEKAGFYGLDLYSLYGSIEAVVGYLDEVDADAAARARERYACFEHFNAETDGQAYAVAAGRGRIEPCEEDVVAQLVELRRRAAELSRLDGRGAEDAHFDAEQNARIVVNAERYYRAMFRGRTSSWNLRDRHMAETLEALSSHLGRGARPARIVVWAHNSHLGDARATEMGRRGELNVGQLVRERHGAEALLVGFTTYAGTVTAASDWGAPAGRKRVRSAFPGSWEALFHHVDLERFLLFPRGHDSRLERAIGVIYLPRTERVSHYFEARLAGQFDAVIHVDETRAVEPLEPASEWEAGELPETYPSAL